MTRILHLVGSPTSDFHADLARLYARDCLAATAGGEDGAATVGGDDVVGGAGEAHVAWVDPGGAWRFPASLDRDAIAAAPTCGLPAALAHVAELDVDVVVPQMFCLPGMTAYRALFDVLGVPYLGNPPEVMALGASKPRARAIVAAAGVAVPAGQVLRPGEHPGVAPPAVVKPGDADNSLGVSLVGDDGGWEAALKEAFAHSDTALVEEFVPPGREVRVGVVERDGELVGLPLEEYRLDAEHRPVRTVEDKLVRDDDGELRLVAKDDPDVWIVDPADPLTARVQEAAMRCHVALGCRDYSLFDFRVDPDGRPWFLEAGLYCSFAPTSVIAVMARADGIGLDDLFATAVRQALARG